MHNATFKLNDEEFAILTSLAEDLRISRTDVVRRALRSFKRQRTLKHELADAYWRRLFERLPDGSMFMIGLDDGQPYVTRDGRERLDDVPVVGEKFLVQDLEAPTGETEYVRIFFLDADNEARHAVGAIPADGGRWLALDRPPTVRIP
jgi:hypothetical protein